jgi:hypothetical protein
MFWQDRHTQMSRIFISYRRQDTAADMADRIYERLASRWRGRVFMDIDSIAGGELFDKTIQDTLQNCAVVLVIIGRDWLSLTNERGARRIDDPLDYPRMEVAAALRRGIRVIPVLTGNVALPTRAELPDDIAGLVDRQFVRVTRERFSADVQRLIAAIAAEMPRERWREFSWRGVATAAVVFAVAIAAFLLSAQDRSTREAAPAPAATAAPAVDAPSTLSADAAQTAPAATPDVRSDRPATRATDGPPAKPTPRKSLQSDTSVAAAPQPPAKLDGLWASDFAQFTDDSRRREVLRLEVDGTTLSGESWQETWHRDSTQPRLYRKFSFSDGAVEGDRLSFCVPVTLLAAVVEKHRNCYTGKIGRDDITFRVTYNLDHPRYPEENGKFVARRIER